MRAKALSKGDAFFFTGEVYSEHLSTLLTQNGTLPLDLAAVGGVASYFMVVDR